MLKTKLISLAAMSAITVGALAPIASVGAETTEGQTEAKFTIENEYDDELVLHKVPNMEFSSIALDAIKLGNITTDFNNTFTRIGNTTEDYDKDGLLVSDYRDTQNWSLTAEMTDFDADSSTTISTTGIDLSLTGNLTSTIGKDASPILNSDDNSDVNETELSVLGATKANLNQNNQLDGGDVGKTFTSDVTWTLNDAPTF